MSTAVTVLGTFTLLYASMLAVAALVCAARRLGPGPGCVGGAVLLELTLAVRAVLDGWALTSGATVAEPAVHAGYLAASVALLPLLVALTRAPSGLSGPAVPAGRPGSAVPPAADAAVLAVGCAALAVIELRLGVTGRPL